MYKALIADDERIGREGIAMLLRQSGLPFDIVQAANGRQALELFHENQPDLLITDIRMPILDGMELIRQVRQENPRLPIMILSGFSDFEYAKTALDLEVSAYILKPVNPEEFQEGLHRLLVKKEKEKSEQKHEMLEVLFGRTKQTEQTYKGMLLIQFDTPFFDSAQDFSSLLSHTIPGSFLEVNMDAFKTLVFLEDQDPALCAQMVLNASQTAWNENIYIAAGAIDKPYLDQANQLEDLLLRKDAFAGQHIFLLNYDASLPDISWKTKLAALAAAKDYAALQTQGQDLMKGSHPSLCSWLKHLFSDALEEVRKQSQEDLANEIFAFYAAPNITQLETALMTLCARAKDQEANVKSHPEVQEVLRCIQEHYDQDLSADQLARHVCLAPSYLSFLFKKETGENLGKYIKRIRMEHAKDLLENTYQKINVIAQSVGYRNVSYFCQSFREYYGISPQKYRGKGD